MRITESQLRKAIKRIIRESDLSDAANFFSQGNVKDAEASLMAAKKKGVKRGEVEKAFDAAELQHTIIDNVYGSEEPM